MNIRDLVRTIAPKPEILKIIRAEAKRKGKNKLTMTEIDRAIAAYRREKRAKDGNQL